VFERISNHKRRTTTDDVAIPGEEIDFAKREVSCSEHHGKDKVADDSRDSRNEDKEHHNDTVHRENPAVSVQCHKVGLWCGELQANSHGQQAANKKQETHANQIENRDALVVERKEQLFRPCSARLGSLGNCASDEKTPHFK
jgi:hypothetical protein